MFRYDYKEVESLINQLKTIKHREPHPDPLIRLKLNKLAALLSMPLCAEQAISIVVEILSLQHDCRYSLANELFHRDHASLIQTFSAAILPLMADEKNDDLAESFKSVIEDFCIRKGNEKIYYTNLKILKEQCISSIDVDYVMQAASLANRSVITANKHAIMVLGKTGAGKSFVLNYMGCPDMFSRTSKFRGHALQIDKTKQPDFLKEIKIGESVVSETSRMGVVDVDRIPTKEMANYHGKDFILCDTPGAGDNRSFMGPELKLANSLETIAPMYKAKSVRFLVLISAKAVDARGEGFKDTIKYVARMFATAADVKTAVKSMVFAISGDEGIANTATFEEQLSQFEIQKVNLGFDEKDMVLIVALKEHFASKKIQFIRPLKDHTATPASLLGVLEKCKAMDPQILKPNAEADIKSQVEQEYSLLTQSVAQIIRSLDGGLSIEQMKKQVKRLSIKFAKLSFLESYHFVEQSNILSSFEGLVHWMRRSAAFSIESLCPVKGAIVEKDAAKAIDYIECLRELEGTIKTIMTIFFAGKRENTVSLARMFVDNIVPPVHYQEMGNRDWSAWVEQNRPKLASDHIEDVIRRYRATLTTNLKGLMQLDLCGIHVEQINRIRGLEGRELAAIPFVEQTTLDGLDNVYRQYAEKMLRPVDIEPQDFNLAVYEASVSENVAKINEPYGFNLASVSDELAVMVTNLRLIDENLNRLLGLNKSLLSTISAQDFSNPAPSAPPLSVSLSSPYLMLYQSISILDEQYQYAVQNFEVFAKDALLRGDLVTAMVVIDHIASITSLFGKPPFYADADLRAEVVDQFSRFITGVTDRLDRTAKSGLPVEEMQALLLDMTIVNDMRTHALFKDYLNLKNDRPYPILLSPKLDSLTTALSNHITNRQMNIETICRQEYSESNFNALIGLMRQVWRLLSLPSANREQSATAYEAIVKRVNDYCMSISGKLAGRLEGDAANRDILYATIKKYLSQLSLTGLVNVLSLEQAEQSLKETVEKRATHLIKHLSGVGFDLGEDANIDDCHEMYKELSFYMNEMADQLPESIINAIRASLQAYLGKIEQTLDSVMPQISSWKSKNDSTDIINLCILMDRFLGKCIDKSLFVAKASEIQFQLANFTDQYATSQSALMQADLRNIHPGSANAQKDSDIVNLRLLDFQKLKDCAPLLYSVCHDPIATWSAALTGLVESYHQSLSESLMTASQSHARVLSDAKVLMKFDDYIKAHDGQSLTFKKLAKRFDHALESEHFPKLQAVMQAIFDGDYKKAQTLATEDKLFASESILRGILIEQIEVFIQATSRSMDVVLKALAANPLDCEMNMRQLMKDYHCMQSAQSLVEAGLLSEGILKNRDQQLIRAQQAIDTWLMSAIARLDQKITQLDFKAVCIEMATLQRTINEMNVKPKNHVDQMTKLQARLVEKPQSCVAQYQQSASNWHKCTDRLEHVAAGFHAARDENVSDRTYGQYWTELSGIVLEGVKNECSAIQRRFANSESSMDETVSELEALVSLTKNLPDESTKLAAELKKIYSATISQIENDNLQKSEGDSVLANIQSLMVARSKQSAILNMGEYQKSLQHLKKYEDTLKVAIMSDLPNEVVPTDKLVAFAKICKMFPGQQFVKTDKKIICDMLDEMVEKCLDDIKYQTSLYANGSGGEHSLKTISHVLAILSAIQRVENINSGIMSFVTKNIPAEVSQALVGIKEILKANAENYDASLKTRNVNELVASLNVAQVFQGVMVSLQTFVNVCRNASMTDGQLRTLTELADNYGYVDLRNKIITEVKLVRDGLRSLDPQLLTGQGSALREAFYTKLKRDVAFIQSMPVLKDHLTRDVLSVHSLGDDCGLAQSLDGLSAYLASTFRFAFHQLRITEAPSVNDNWVEFNRYYQELIIFVEQCRGQESLDQLKLRKKSLLDDAAADVEIPATMVVEHLKLSFDNYLENVISIFNEKNKADVHSDAYTNNLVSLLAGLQKMAEDMPVLEGNVNAAVNKFLAHVQSIHAKGYIGTLAECLTKEQSGFGARMVNGQSIFAGMMTAQRNELTRSQDIDYVLSHMEVEDRDTGIIRHLTDSEISLLRAQYVGFNEAYTAKIDHHTALATNFAQNGNRLLQGEKTELERIINELNIDLDAEGHIVWNSKITNAIPYLFINLFVIWTLKSSSAFFDATNTDSNKDFLKKPHPAQMVAIFCMLNTLDPGFNVLPSHIEEVLTGQGKSVVLASTASLLSLLGFAVNIGCYSEYLSSRDADAFKWFFDFLGVTDYVSSGTFNRLSEDWLNQNGDLRNLMSNKLLGTHLPVKPQRSHGRQTIALVDEIDSLVTAFFGYLYQPYFLLQSDAVNNLLDAIWEKRSKDAIKSFRDLTSLPQYTACLELYEGREYLIEVAAREMFDDLKQYKHEHGHDFHVNANGDLYYKHFDGTAMSKSIGYRTLWACMDRSNNVSADCLAKHKGIKITCGAYSYADLMRDRNRYRAILGVTGTYRELSLAEKAVVKDVFGIRGASFIPSAYGMNKLQFNPGNQFRVVEDDEYDNSLCENIAKARVGWTNPNVQRPVIVFFETEELLETFYRSPAFAYYQRDANIMSSQTITTAKERDSLISRATRAGVITLAIQEHGRGNDFILTDPQVIANGGLAAMDAFMPETEAEQRQHQGRAARQGQEGSFSIVVKKSEIQQKFGLVEHQVEAARMHGHLYQLVSNARNKKFSDGYQKLVDDSAMLLEKMHEPSMELLAIASNPHSPVEAIIDAHKRTLPSAQAALHFNDAKVLILFDSTGSMGDLIDALKAVLADVVDSLRVVLESAGANFSLQIAHYEDYSSGIANAFRATPRWSNDPAELKAFVSKVMPAGGGGNSSECVEVGLCYANSLIPDGLNHVILIGDEPPSTKAEMAKLRSGVPYVRGFYHDANHYRIESESLKNAHVPVSTFFTRNSKFNSLKHKSGAFLTEHRFNNIANITGGDAGELHLSDPPTAINEITSLFGRKIIGAVAGEGNDAVADDLYNKFKQRMDQRRQ